MKMKLISFFSIGALLVWTGYLFFTEDGAGKVGGSKIGVNQANYDERLAIAGTRRHLPTQSPKTGIVTVSRSSESRLSFGQVSNLMESYREKAWSEGRDLDESAWQHLKKYSPTARKTAIDQIHILNDPEAISVLSNVLAEDVDSKVRLEAILALDAIEGEEAVDALTIGLSDADEALRRQVIEALWNRGSQTTHILGQVLFSDPDPHLRVRAVELLAEDGGAAAKSLLQAAVEDEDIEVSLTAEALLRSWPEDSNTQADSIEPYSGELFLTVISESDGDLQEVGFFNLDPEERIVVMQELNGTEVEEAVKILGEILLFDQDISVRQEAVKVLEGIGGDTAVAAIATGLSDREVLVRQGAMEALWNQGNHTVHVIGQVLFGDPDTAMRYRAVELLAANATPAAIALLQAATEDPDESISHIALQKLRHL